MNKIHPSVFFVFQFVQDFSIKDKERDYIRVLFQRVIKTGIVTKAQIPSEPEDYTVWREK